MSDLDKIEKWIDDRLVFAALAVDNTKDALAGYKLALTKTEAYIQSLKAEKKLITRTDEDGIPVTYGDVQPDKGERALEILREFRNTASPSERGASLIRSIDFIESQHKEKGDE